MVPWVECETLDVDLDLPVSQRFRAPWEQTHGPAVELLNALRREMPARAKFAGYFINLRTWGRYWRESRAIAKLSSSDWREMMAAALSYEFVVGIFACSTMALATDRGPVLARNMDFWPEKALARASYVIRCRRRGRTEMHIGGWPGAMGVVTGMSSRGFAIALNAVASPDGIDRRGYPILLFMREVLEQASSFAAAVAMLSTQRLMAGALFTIVGRSNDERMVIERMPRAAAQRTVAGAEPLLTTNSYRELSEPSQEFGHQLWQTSCSRYSVLNDICHDPQFLGTNPSDEALLFALTDDRILQPITAQHVIARPHSDEFRMFVPQRLLEQPARSG
jgi:hypothetical protein